MSIVNVRVSLLLLPAVLCGAARAAEAPVALAEVVVTAQKVAENLFDVPISVSVVDSAQLQNQHIQDIADLTRAVPNFSFTSNGNPGGSILEMRGISSAAGASPVAIYLDDVSITSRTTSGSVGQPEPTPLDIQQVEVLRGPQGTLYGASAEAGVLKFRTNPVNLTDFGGSGLAEVSNTKDGGTNYRVNGVLNMPVVDGVLGVRLAAQSDRDAGYIDRYSPDTGELLGSGINDRNSTVARISVEARPIDGLSIAASVFYQRTAFGSTDTVTLALGGLATNQLVPDSGVNKLIVPSLTIKYDAGFADFTSVTSDYTRNAPFNYDGTVFNSVYIGQCFLDGLCGAPPIPDLNGNLSGSQISALPSPAIDGFFTRQISQELRFNSKPYTAGGSPLTWVAGAYFQKSDDSISDYEYIPGFNTTFTNLYGSAVLNDVFGGPLPDDLVFFGRYHFQEKQYSVFGDATFHVNEALRISAGLRYLTARLDVNRSAGGFFNGGDSSIAEKSKDHALTPKFSVEYDLNQKAMAYATASKGFRLGGPNTPVISFCDSDLANLGLTAAPGSYGHDSLWNYELGVKARPTGRVSVNTAVFYDRWSQLQQSIALPTCGSGFTTNLGAARSYGAEADVTALLAEGLTASVSGGYTHATLTDSVPSMNIAAGARVEGVPDWSSTASLEYRRNITAALGGVVRGNYSYVGNSHGTLVATDPDYQRPAYGLAGASIGAVYNEWEISIYAKNLFNEQKIIQTPSHATVPIGFVLMPRTIGLSVSGKF
jgi:iron complex outermembrane receptor protein